MLIFEPQTNEIGSYFMPFCFLRENYNDSSEANRFIQVILDPIDSGDSELLLADRTCWLLALALSVSACL